MKLNLGCGFRKKEGFLNVDLGSYCEPDLEFDLSKNPWPWAESSVSEVHFEYSLEQMGENKNDLLFIFKELYRVCQNEARIFITATHPRHDQFVMNPLCIHPLSPPFLQTLSVAANLEQIAQGQGDTCLGMMLGVNFKIGRVKFLVASQFQALMEQGKISEESLRERMNYENNICQAMEIELTTVKELR